MEKDEKFEEQQKKINESEIKIANYYKSLIIHRAYYPSVDNRATFYVEFSTKDELRPYNTNTLKQEMVRTAVESPMLNRVLEVFTYDDILEQTIERQENLVKLNEEFNQFVEWKNEGKILQNENEEIKSKLTLEDLESLVAEDLFKLKLEIFEKEEVQNSDNRELRSSIRKSKDAIELLHYYWAIKNETNSETG